MQPTCQQYLEPLNPRRGPEGSSRRVFGGRSPAHILVLDFWPPETGKNQLLLFESHPVCDSWSQQPQDTDSGRSVGLPPRP